MFFFFRFNCISSVFLFSISHGSSQSNAKLGILRKKLLPLSLPPFQAAVLLKTYHCLLLHIFFSLYYNIFLSNSYFALNISYICISTVRAANFQTIFPGHTITLGQRIAPKAVFHPDLWPRYFTKRSPSVFVTPANWTICCRILPPSLTNLTIFVLNSITLQKLLNLVSPFFILKMHYCKYASMQW